MAGKSLSPLLLTVLTLGLSCALHAETILIDANANRHPIDPRIYGVANASGSVLSDLNCPLNRQGGNAASRYNWKLNASNRGMDWYFESLPDGSATQGEAGDTFVTDSRSGGAQPMLTLPMIGWVAKLGANRGNLCSFSIAKYGAQADADWNYFPDAGNGVLQNGQFVTGNDPNDANVPADSTFQQDWVRHLVGKFGTAANGGLRYYILDNEHSIWQSTHRDVKPTGATMAEIRDKMIDYGTKVKAVDAGALVVGPEEWGWSGYLLSGYDQQWGSTHGWSNLPDRTANGNWDYLPWLLDQLRQNNTATGKRVLDIFTVHYYPQGGEFSDDVSSAMQLRRNRSTRSLWDPNYVDETWIGTQVKLIPRLRGWVNQYYPGTQIGITEYNWGAESHINGATAQADVFGIFGRENLDIAARWTTPASNTPTYKAMKMYRNYDGQRSTFGETSVSTSVTNPDNLSAFSALRTADGALTVMIVNKATSSTAVTTSLSNFTAAGSAQVWQLTSSNAINHLANLTLSNNNASLTVPAQSITLLVIAPQNTQEHPPVITTAAAATPNPALTGQNITFSVAASDQDNDPLTYAWTFGDGASGSGASATHAYTSAGTFSAKVTVSDGRGGSVSSSVSVTINTPPANQPPVISSAAKATPASAVTGQSIAFTVAASDPDGDPLTYAWTFGDGATASGANATHAYANAGTFSAKVTVSDGRGGSVSSSVSVTISAPPANKPPVISSAAKATPASAVTGQAIAFTVAATDPDGDPLTYAWTFGDGATATGANATHAYSNAGTFSAKVTVSDGRGGSATSSVSVTINTPPVNQPPALSSAAKATPASAITGQSISFTVAASDPEGLTLTYAWNFGDGSSGNTAIAAHAYTAVGTYHVVVTIKDPGGLSVTSSVDVVVTIPPGGGDPGTGGGGSNGDPGTGGSGGSGGGVAPLPITNVKLIGKMRFNVSGQDGCAVSGTLQVPTTVSLAGAQIQLSIGGATGTWTLDSKYRATSANGAISFKLKPAKRGQQPDGTASFKAILKKGNYGQAWQVAGLGNMNATALVREISLTLDIDAVAFETVVPALYTAKQNVSGRFKY